MRAEAEPLVTPRPPRKQQQRSFRTQEKLLHAAIEAFAENGFKGTSTRDIAQRAGVHHPLITYHFHSKEDLWRAAADRVFGTLREALEAAREGAADATPKGRMAAMMRRYVHYAAGQPALHRILLLEGSRPSPRLDWLVQKHLQPFVSDGVDEIRLLQKRGVVPSGDSALIFHMIFVAAGGLLALGPKLVRTSNIDFARSGAADSLADLLVCLFLPGDDPEEDD